VDVKSFIKTLIVEERAIELVWCDNKSAICMASNLAQHDRTKHVEIDRFHIKEKLDEDIIRINNVRLSN
jgi:hypothetical protein